MMSPANDRERWQRVAAICDQALELEGPARAEYLAAACGGDAGLRREVDALLAQTGSRRRVPLDTGRCARGRR